MYTGFKPNNSINKSNVSGLNETEIQSLQKQVDTYTRKLQQEKRKFYAIQDQHKNISDQYTKEKQKLNQLKKQTTRPQTIILQSKIKNLQANLDKSISTFDDTVAYNNKLKGQIDMLRREKKNYLEMQRSLEQQMKKLQSQTNEKMDLLNKKKKKAEDIKQQIEQMKQRNQEERQMYLNKFSSLQKEYMNDRGGNQDLGSSKLKGSNSGDFMSLNVKNEIIDTQPLLKFRLKRLIASNKQKLKMIQQYKKHMQMIEQAFNQIKQKSNINDLDEITNTFIRSEEQNYSLYNYMDELNQNIDALDEQNKMLEQKIQQKIFNDEEKKNQIQQQIGVADDFGIKSKDSMIMEEEVKQKEKESEDLIVLVQKIRSTLQATLVELADSNLTSGLEQNRTKMSEDYKVGLNINDRNINDYLSDLERHINAILLAKQQAQTQVITQIKESVTAYSKPIPNVNYDEIMKEKYDREKEKEDNKFLQENKFRQYAIQFWQKRKNPINNSKIPLNSNNISYSNLSSQLGQLQKEKLNLVLNNRQTLISNINKMQTIGMQNGLRDGSNSIG